MPDLEAQFEQFVNSLNAASEPSFHALLELIHQARYSGAITLHCQNGVPKIAELGKPIRIDLTRRVHVPADRT